jgi:hypothetical protein
LHSSISTKAPKVNSKACEVSYDACGPPQLEVLDKIAPLISIDVKKNDHKISHTNGIQIQSESGDDEKAKQLINVIVEDVDSHDDSSLVCAENMDAHPLANNNIKAQSVETPLAAVLLKIQGATKNFISEPRRDKDEDPKVCRSGQKDLKNQATKFFEERGS